MKKIKIKNKILNGQKKKKKKPVKDINATNLLLCFITALLSYSIIHLGVQNAYHSHWQKLIIKYISLMEVYMERQI